MNVIDASGILAVSTRLQRLSDRIRKEVALIYQENKIDFQPKWFPVIYTLHHKPVLSVVELAAEIGYSHPSTISLLKELEKEKLIRSKKDKSDTRKRMIVLTEAGKNLVSKMQPVWEIMTKALTELTDTTNNLMKAIEEVETQLDQKSFLERSREVV
ncbi:MAG: MarR family transcriptional regulator [Chitinophagaceae bacterium]|nr:MAG: MarR family transcriptional regulator [Chitinophagaceae bacterium]